MSNARKILRDVAIFLMLVSVSSFAQGNAGTITTPLCELAATMKTVFLIVGGAACFAGLVKAGYQTAMGDQEGPHNTKMAVIGSVIVGLAGVVASYLVGVFSTSSACT